MTFLGLPGMYLTVGSIKTGDPNYNAKAANNTDKVRV
jgi:hypothetical protein